MRLFLAHLLAGPTMGWLVWRFLPRELTWRKR